MRFDFFDFFSEAEKLSWHRGGALRMHLRRAALPCRSSPGSGCSPSAIQSWNVGSDILFVTAMNRRKGRERALAGSKAFAIILLESAPEIRSMAGTAHVLVRKQRE